MFPSSLSSCSLPRREVVEKAVVLTSVVEGDDVAPLPPAAVVVWPPPVVAPVVALAVSSPVVAGVGVGVGDGVGSGIIAVAVFEISYILYNFDVRVREETYETWHEDLGYW